MQRFVYCDQTQNSKKYQKIRVGVVGQLNNKLGSNITYVQVSEMFLNGEIEKDYYNNYSSNVLYNNEKLASNSQLSKLGFDIYEIVYNGQKKTVTLLPEPNCTWGFTFHYQIQCSHTILSVQFENNRKPSWKINYFNFISKYYRIDYLYMSYMLEMVYVDFSQFTFKDKVDYPQQWKEIKKGRREKERSTTKRNQ